MSGGQTTAFEIVPLGGVEEARTDGVTRLPVSTPAPVITVAEARFTLDAMREVDEEYYGLRFSGRLSLRGTIRSATPDGALGPLRVFHDLDEQPFAVLPVTERGSLSTREGTFEAEAGLDTLTAGANGLTLRAAEAAGGGPGTLHLRVEIGVKDADEDPPVPTVSPVTVFPHPPEDAQPVLVRVPPSALTGLDLLPSLAGPRALVPGPSGGRFLAGADGQRPEVMLLIRDADASPGVPPPVPAGSGLADGLLAGFFAGGLSLTAGGLSLARLRPGPKHGLWTADFGPDAPTALGEPFAASVSSRTLEVVADLFRRARDTRSAQPRDRVLIPLAVCRPEFEAQVTPQMSALLRAGGSLFHFLLTRSTFAETWDEAALGLLLGRVLSDGLRLFREVGPTSPIETPDFLVSALSFPALQELLPDVKPWIDEHLSAMRRFGQPK